MYEMAGNESLWGHHSSIYRPLLRCPVRCDLSLLRPSKPKLARPAAHLDCDSIDNLSQCNSESFAIDASRAYRLRSSGAGCLSLRVICDELEPEQIGPKHRVSLEARPALAVASCRASKERKCSFTTRRPVDGYTNNQRHEVGNQLLLRIAGLRLQGLSKHKCILGRVHRPADRR
jgi:hypothetical protein